MSHSTRVNFVLCWHMHQPWYQQGINGDYQLPWVYLHAIKDYSDMAAHLEANPGMKVVVNFAPVLLEQIDDYASQLGEWLKSGAEMKDPILNLLAGTEDIPADIHGRYDLLCACRRAHAPKMIDPYPSFRLLLEPLQYMFPQDKCVEKDTEFLQFLSKQYFVDLLVWYHLAWLGHSLKQTETSKRLIAKAKFFDKEDRRELIQLIHDCMKDIIPRYRKLAENDQVELSMTPYYHPIVPLLNDMDNMNCAQPGVGKPSRGQYPGGVERSRWHIEKGIACFQHYFGITPTGIWLSEGGISKDSIALIEEYGFTWTASGEGVWRNSINLSRHDPETVHSKRALFHSYQLDEHKPKIFFRDDGLSDLIGFEYANQNSVEAADDLVQHLVNISKFLGERASEHVVTIILDGENAWEYYPHNGYHFLNHLYKKLSNHKHVLPGHFSKLTNSSLTHELDKLCAGSWVYGSFSTWVGSDDKNRAWDLLIDAKKCYDKAVRKGTLSELQIEQATKQLAVCEGSDWFWWFGDHNPSDSVSDFDKLYRNQLKNLYVLLDENIPKALDKTVSTGGGSAANAGTMRRNV